MKSSTVYGPTSDSACKLPHPALCEIDQNTFDTITAAFKQTVGAASEQYFARHNTGIGACLQHASSMASLLGIQGGINACTAWKGSSNYSQWLSGASRMESIETKRDFSEYKEILESNTVFETMESCGGNAVQLSLTQETKSQ